MTIRHLLGHTAGLPDYGAMQSLLDSGEVVGNVKLQEYMGATSPHPMHEPGSTFSYCNTCYDTLALLAERVAGASFSDLAEKDCLGGLGAVRAFVRPVRFEDWRQPKTLGFASSLPDAEVVDVSKAGPILQVNQGPIYNMYPVGFGVLYVPGKDAFVEFETSNDPSAPSLTWSSVFTESEGLRLRR